MPNKEFPTILNNFNVYLPLFDTDGLTVSGEAWQGVGEITLPDIAEKTGTINLAGMSGEIEVPIVGQFSSMTVQISVPMLCAEQLLMSSGSKMLIFRGAAQMYNRSKGAVATTGITVTVRGQVKKLGLGKLAKASAMDGSLEMEVDYLKIVIDNVPYIEIDKWNNLFVCGGLDQLSAVNAAI